MPQLTLLVHAKDEESRLLALHDASRPFVDRIVALADVDSTDTTVALARKIFDECYPVRFPGSFADLLNLGLAVAAARCASADWTIWLDADERMGPPAWRALRALLATVPDRRGVEHKPVALPRRRWGDAEMTRLIAPGPDWQVRLFRADSPARFARRVHPRLANGDEAMHLAESHGVVIEHFHDLKTAGELANRQRLYRELAREEGIAVEGGQELDMACRRCGAVRRVHAGAFDYATPPFTSPFGCLGFE